MLDALLASLALVLVVWFAAATYPITAAILRFLFPAPAVYSSPPPAREEESGIAASPPPLATVAAPVRCEPDGLRAVRRLLREQREADHHAPG